MLVFQNNGGTVEYASNGVGVTNTAVGLFLQGLRCNSLTAKFRW